MPEIDPVQLIADRLSNNSQLQVRDVLAAVESVEMRLVEVSYLKELRELIHRYEDKIKELEETNE